LLFSPGKNASERAAFMELFGDFIRMQLLVVTWGTVKFPDGDRKIWKNLLRKIDLYNFLPELQMLFCLQF